MEKPPEPIPTRARGGCLAVFLIATMILNSAMSLFYLFLSSRLLKTGLPLWALVVLIALGIANFDFAFQVWKWKRWGVYGLVFSCLVALGVNVALHLPPATLVLGLLGPGILILLIRPHWQSMA